MSGRAAPARILLVEDHRPLAEDVSSLLEELLAPVTVTRRERAEEALHEAAREPFDVAIVDVRLPGTDGMQLVPALKERVPEGEVLVVTGHASLESAVAAVRHGAFAYVLKPFDPEELVHLVGRALEQVRLRRERSELQRRLAASEALHRAVVDHVEALILGLDARGHICLANRFATRALARDVTSLRGLPLSELGLQEEDRETLQRLVRAARRGEGEAEVAAPAPEAHQVSGRERPARVRGEGGAREVRWTVTPLRPKPGGEVALVAVGLDVTERIEMERRSAANEALAALGRLTAGLAHEIRNPLNAATLQLELLSRAAARLPEDRGIGHRAAIVREEVQRLSRLLQDFLSLARPSAMRRDRVTLEVLFDEVVQLQLPLAERHGVALSTHVAGGLTAVRGDAPRLKQVLINLVGNALDALTGRGGGHIELRAEPAERPGWVRLEVADDGPGLPQEEGERLFEPFVTTKEGGTGLGLALVRQVVEQHGGKVTLRPRPGGGAVARLTLPATTTEP